jgi:hypothetical protein
MLAPPPNGSIGCSARVLVPAEPSIPTGALDDASLPGFCQYPCRQRRHDTRRNNQDYRSNWKVRIDIFTSRWFGGNGAGTPQERHFIISDAPVQSSQRSCCGR